MFIGVKRCELTDGTVIKHHYLESDGERETLKVVTERNGTRKTMYCRGERVPDLLFGLEIKMHITELVIIEAIQESE